MAVERSLTFGEENRQAEIEYLQRGLLPTLVPLVALAGWAWLVYVLNRERTFGRHVIPAAVLFLAAYLGHRLSRRRYALACWSLLLGLINALAAIMLHYPSLDLAAFGVLIILVAHALLGLRQALLAMALTALATGWAGAASGGDVPGPALAHTLTLYALALGVAWLAARPFRQSVESALTGWVRARDALIEVQERRAELYRVVRALEEATYRIEHMNNALLVAQREAEEARALKARFAATVSHEIRGPLNLILGFSRMMALAPERYGEPLPRAYHEDVDTIYRNSQHLLALVDDVLDLSQIEAQKLPLVKDRIDLEEDVVKRVVSTVRPLAERKGLYLRQELAGSLPWILADPVRLRQALLNLLTNAIRYTEHGGITVRTAHRDGRIAVAVQDTGPGIPPEAMPKLFKEFRQVQATETREGAGSGLGLAICKHLVELHGGEVWAESQPGTGTTFHLALPLPGVEPVAAGLVRGESVAGLDSPKTCLIVHDDPGTIRMLSRYLEGYRIVGVPSTEDLPALTEELRPRAIVAGHEQWAAIAARLAQTPYEVPLIRCALPRALGAQPSAGLLAYLAKPVLPEMLTSIMRRVLHDGEATVLLVDDDPDAVRLLERMLLSLPRPYHILKAYNGERALELMQTSVPDVIFLDWVMPGMDGAALVARMRADPRLHEVPVVIVSARDWGEDQAALGTELTVQWRRPVPMAKGTRCLQSLLDTLSPDYLSTGALTARPAPVT